MHAAAVETLEAREQETLFIGSYCNRREGKADRTGVLHDRYAVEVLFERREEATRRGAPRDVRAH